MKKIFLFILHKLKCKNCNKNKDIDNEICQIDKGLYSLSEKDVCLDVEYIENENYNFSNLVYSNNHISNNHISSDKNYNKLKDELRIAKENFEYQMKIRKEKKEELLNDLDKLLID